MTYVLAGSLPIPALQSWTLGPISTFFRVGKWLQCDQSQNARHRHRNRTFKPHRDNKPRRRSFSPRTAPYPTDKTIWSECTRYSLERSYSTSPSTQTTNNGLVFRLAAASCGKGRQFSPLINTYPFDPTTQDHVGVETGASLFERKISRPNSGQDAFFIAKINNQPDSIAFGIADGVGGWADRGVDPADFSHGLCSRMALAAFNWPTSEERLRPGNLMQSGYDAVLQDRKIRAGGSTACVGSVNAQTGRLQMANLGDSGFLLLRTGRAHYYSNPQTHAFNTPYQLSIVPPKILAQASVFGGEHYIDTPARADLSEDTMQEGDVLILATDGVWDNLNSQDMLNIVKKKMIEKGAWISTPSNGITVASEDKLAELTHLTPSVTSSPTSKSPSSAEGAAEKGNEDDYAKYALNALQSTLASSIVSAARTASLDPRRDGPFAKEVQKRYPQDGWRGGKVDDICVVVLVAVKNSGHGGLGQKGQKGQKGQMGQKGEAGDRDDMEVDVEDSEPETKPAQWLR